MNRFDIRHLAFVLQARMFSQLLSACPDMSILTALVLTHVATRNQQVYTLENWIVDTRRICLFQLPEQCESKQHLNTFYARAENGASNPC